LTPGEDAALAASRQRCDGCLPGGGCSRARERVAMMASDEKTGYWLFKQEPECYSYADLERDGRTVWDGVTNSLAQKNLRQVRVGDRILFYHTGKQKAVVGEMGVARGPRPASAED